MTWNASRLSGSREHALSHLIEANKVDVAVVTDTDMPSTEASGFALEGFVTFSPLGSEFLMGKYKVRVLIFVRASIADTVKLRPDHRCYPVSKGLVLGPTIDATLFLRALYLAPDAMSRAAIRRRVSLARYSYFNYQNWYFEYQLLLKYQLLLQIPICYLECQNWYFEYQLLLQIPIVTSITNCYFQY
jgi:hypothetical protein